MEKFFFGSLRVFCLFGLLGIVSRSAYGQAAVEENDQLDKMPAGSVIQFVLNKVEIKPGETTLYFKKGNFSFELEVKPAKADRMISGKFKLVVTSVDIGSMDIPFGATINARVFKNGKQFNLFTNLSVMPTSTQGNGVPEPTILDFESILSEMSGSLTLARL